ncbi:MAG: hypothetical protein JWN69_2552 [Alphaproteobacteria bacterium]|nr:hypothetical protein [Alphaproteobacteria bacterium]
MKVHLVHAHPEPDSFVAAMRDVMVERFTAAGAEVTVADLYAMKFDPVMSAADFGDRRNPDHVTYALEQRHGYETRTLAPDILAEIDKVLAADVLAFTFPLFWFSVPAILKGWIERVLISGPFYGGRRIYGHGGVAGKRALAAFSLGGRPHMFGPDAVHGELETGMMRHFFQGTLGYIGLQVLEPFVAYHVPYVDDGERGAILTRLGDHVDRIEQLPVLPMPDLARFDATFQPLG